MFGQEPHLKVHLIRNHGISLKDNSLTHSKDCSDERGKFICTVELCKKEHNSFQTLIIHLKEHIRDQELITCPYRDCDKQYSILSSFTGHLTKKHKNRTPDTEKDLSAEDNCNNVDVPSDIDIEQADSHAIHDVPSTTDDLSGTTNDSAGSSNLSIDLFHTNIAQLYLKLESEFLVPNSTIQHIVTANNAIDEQRLDILKSRLFQRLEKENVQLDLIHKIMSIMNEVDPIPLTNKLFGTMTLFKLKYRDRPLKICIANSLEDLLNSAKEKFDLDPDETYKITLDQDGTEIEEYEVLDQLANLSNEPIVLKVMSENNEELNPLVQVNPVIAAQNITTQFEVTDAVLDTTAGTARKFAEALCERYRASFITEIPGLTFYNHDDFFKQSIYNALNYSKGKSNSVKRKASDDSDDEAVKEKEKEDELRKRQDQYGCVNFSPSLPEDENTDSQEEKRVMLMKLCENPGKNQTEIINLIKATYPSVRKELNEKIGICLHLSWTGPA
uniref:C2H2-type domain-containing protein n=1 Tax=Trichogramma kaykai TaxID=54128 RepID=A0ABD2WD80_9HYME